MQQFRYKAFISYAHADKRWAAWLHRKLETYRIPKQLSALPAGSRGLKPVFRDRDELTASGALAASLQKALADSEFLIVICSPASARSHWVGEEIRSYRALNGSARVLPVIVDGEPGATDGRECFPAALTEPEPGSDTLLEVIAADARKAGDGPRLAFLKLAAGMLDVGLDALVQREHARRQQRLAMIAAASVIGMAGTLTLAGYAELQRREAVAQRAVAVQNERRSEATVKFLIDTFQVANPATENANTITARSIIDRGAERIQVDLAGEPLVQGQLYTALGEIFGNLGAYDRSLTLLNSGYVRLKPGSTQAVQNRVALVQTLYGMGKFDAALKRLDDIEQRIRAQNPADRGLLATIHSRRGFVLRSQIKLDEALGEFDRAVAIFDRAGKRFTPEKLQAQMMKGTILTYLGRYGEAQTILMRTLAEFQQIYGNEHQRTGQVLNNLAFNAVESKDAASAIRFGDQSLAIYAKVLSPPHPALARAYMLQGRAYELNGDADGAAEAYRDALEIFKAAYPQGYFETGFAQTYLALLLSAKGRADEALRLIDDAKWQYDVSYGRLNANHGDLEVHRAIVLAAAGRRAEAARACERGRDILDQTLGIEAHPAQALIGECRKRQLLPPA